jgi:acyl-CoA thioesterase
MSAQEVRSATISAVQTIERGGFRFYRHPEAESASQGRGLVSGRFYDLDGHLVATCMQEGLMRWNG